MKIAFFLILGFCLISCSHGVKPLAPNNKISFDESSVVINPLAKKYIVSNLATLKLRVYQINCESCDSELIFETDMVIGKDEDFYRTKLGYYKITRWEQFHEDYQKKYLSWYKNPPSKNSSRKQWKNIGAFGWYAAIIEPSASGQWLHGTIGWAEEGEKFIEGEYSPSGAYIRVKSKGCTRVSNIAVAFLKDHVPVGSYIFRIYAQEKLLNPPNSPKTVYWSHQLVHRGKTLDGGSWSRTIEVKDYIIKNKLDKILGEKSNNPYDLNINNLGVFYVDKGQIFNYQHPSSLPSDGFKKAPVFFTFTKHE
jgi:hypothetical protein